MIELSIIYLVRRFDAELQVQMQPVHEDGEELVGVLLLAATERALVFAHLALCQHYNTYNWVFDDTNQRTYIFTSHF